MKRIFPFCFVLLSVTGCGEDQAEDNASNGAAELPTFDSTTINDIDSVPQILHLDNPAQDSTPITLDAPGTTILPQDTNYRKKTKQ